MDAKWLLGKEFKNALIVVADNSEDRLVHLKRIGMNPRRLPSNFKADLLYGLGLTPFTLAKTSAEAKACDVAAQLKNKQENYDMVLGFHTVEVIDNKIIPKPSNRDEALAILKQLNNRWHSVITGATCFHSSQKFQTFAVETQVKYGNIPEEILTEYVETDEWMNQNSAYGKASAFIESNNGCFFNILGVPIFDVVKAIRNLMLDVEMKSLTATQSPMDQIFATYKMPPCVDMKSLTDAQSQMDQICTAPKMPPCVEMKSLTVAQSPMDQTCTTPKMPPRVKPIVRSSTQEASAPNAFDDFWDQLSEPTPGPRPIKRRFYKNDNFVNEAATPCRRFTTPLPSQHQTPLKRCQSATVNVSKTIPVEEPPTNSAADSQETRVEECQTTPADESTITAEELTAEESAPKIIRDAYSSTFFRATGQPGLYDLRRAGIELQKKSFDPTHSYVYSDQDDWG
uniref:Maf-like protein n=1 Tax=Panagrolaimus sp. PS1159 TaxID=55785 RepID=A0AC35G8P8_9BILA